MICWFYSIGSPGGLGARGTIGDAGYPGSYVLTLLYSF